MSKIINLLITILLANFASAQSMLNLNEPSLVKKAQIEKCIEVQNDKVLWTMCYDTNGYEKNTAFIRLIMILLIKFW